MNAEEIELLEQLHADALANGDYEAAADIARCLATTTHAPPEHCREGRNAEEAK